jgi:hypothetical protein
MHTILSNNKIYTQQIEQHFIAYKNIKITPHHTDHKQLGSYSMEMTYKMLGQVSICIDDQFFQNCLKVFGGQLEEIPCVILY